MKDCHVHTKISHDGISKMEEYLKVAKDVNVDEITFTEHYDIYDGLETDLETLNVQEYYNYYKQLRNISNFKFNFGIEVGLQPDIVNTIQNVTNKYPFDFIIGSSHITCKKDMSMDKSFFEGYSRKEAYLRYFKEVLQNIRLYNEFDVYGHLDYVVRYGEYAEKKIEYDEFKEILDEILKTIINKNKGIEINTSGIRYGLGNPHPNIEILKRYRELGGKIITVGSDAHKIQDLAKDFDVAFDILTNVGFEDIAIYHERKPDFIKIKELK